VVHNNIAFVVHPIRPIDYATDFAFQIICFNFGGIDIEKIVV